MAAILFLPAADALGIYYDGLVTNDSYQPTRLIVKFDNSRVPLMISPEKGLAKTGQSDIDRLNNKYEVRNLKSLLSKTASIKAGNRFRNVYIFETAPGIDIEAFKNEFKTIPGIIYAEPDYTVEFYDTPDDPLYQFQWNLENNGQEHYHVLSNWGTSNDELILTAGIPGADIGAGQVYGTIPDQTTVVVAIIDTGVDMVHPDLAANIWVNPGEIPDNGLDDDHNGYIDDMHGWDFASSIDALDLGDNDPTDTEGHGTHCAGIVAAVTDNAVGIAGIATNCRIMALKFDPLPLVTRIARAIIYAADNGAKVVNMSFGLNFRSDLIEEAINYAHDKGVILCAASGNDGAFSYNFPAAYAATIAIGASNDSDQVTSFSTYGDHLSVVAPGYMILSLRAGNTDMYGSEWPYERKVHIIDTIYYLASGTSMSCPHGVGAAAVLQAASPGLTPEKTRQILEQSAVDIVDPYGVGWNYPGFDNYCGYGRLNLDGALSLIPEVRAMIESPRPNEIVSGMVDIIGLADGNDFTEYSLDYGPGADPESWYNIINSNTPVTDENLAVWNTSQDGLNGRYTLRLSCGDDNVYYTSVYIANDTVVEITSPIDGETISDFIQVLGRAYSPEFGYSILEYKPASADSGWEEIASVSWPLYDEAIEGWFLEEIPESPYDLRLSLYSFDSLLKADTISVYIQSMFGTDQAWKAPVNGYPAIITTYCDHDNDGVNEILLGTSAGMMAFNPDGTAKTDGLPFFPRNNYMIPPAIGEINGDGIDDIVAVGYDPPKVYIFPSGGERIENYLGITPPVGNYYRTESEFPKVFLKDIDSDGLDEIFVYIYDGDLSKTFIFRPDGSLLYVFNYFYDILSVDLDNDGLDEFYACNLSYCLLRQIDAVTGQTIDSLLIQMNGSDFNIAGFSAYDIDNDDVQELIMYGYYLDYNYWIYAFDGGLNLLPGWPHEMGVDTYVVPSVPIFGDIDDDGEAEYFSTFFDISTSYVLAWNLDGSSYIPNSHNGLFATTPEPSVMNMLLLGDINGDSRIDVVACANNDMFDTYNAQRIYAWDADGAQIPGFPLITVRDVYTSDRFTPSLGDINRDGHVDLVITTPDSNQIFVNYPGAEYDECSFPVPFWRVNRRMNNIGRLPSLCHSTAVEDHEADILPETCRLSQNVPNPFNPITTIEYSLPQRSPVSIEVYNIIGRKVATLVDDTKGPGNYRVTWDGTADDGTKAGSGIYLYRLKTGKHSETRKMILLK